MSTGGSAGQRELKSYSRFVYGQDARHKHMFTNKARAKLGRKSCVLPVSPCELHGGEKEKHALFPPFGLATVCTKSNCAFFPPNWKITELPGRCVEKSLGLGSQDGLQGMSLPEKDKDRLYMSPVLFKEFTPPDSAKHSWTLQQRYFVPNSRFGLFPRGRTQRSNKGKKRTVQ